MARRIFNARGIIYPRIKSSRAEFCDVFSDGFFNEILMTRSNSIFESSIFWDTLVQIRHECDISHK